MSSSGGIEQGRIVADGDDRNAFVNRLGTVAEKTGTAIYAWALLDNHVHLLLKSGLASLPTCMRKLLSWYAQYYNPTDSEFVKTILDETEEQVKYQISERDHPEQVKKDIKQVCTESALTLSQFRSGGRMKPLPEIRNKLAVRFVREYGLSLAEATRQLGATTSAVYQIIQKESKG